MIAVVYLEKVVCEAHDINSAFTLRKCTSKLPQNNEQERGEERKRRRVWMQDIRSNGNQRPTVKCRRYYRFMFHLLPRGEPHIGRLSRIRDGKKKKKKSCHGSVGARQLGKKTERWSGEPEEKAAPSAGSYLVWVQWEEGWEEVGGPYICPPHGGLQWVGCTVHFLHCMFLQAAGVVWERTVVVMMVMMLGGYQGEKFHSCRPVHWCSRWPQVQVPTKVTKQSIILRSRCKMKAWHQKRKKKNRPPVSRQLCDPAGPSRLISRQNKFNGCHVIQSFSATASVQLLFHCHSLPQLVENAARLRQRRDSRCQTHMTANRPWRCGLLLWLETGLN